MKRVILAAALAMCAASARADVEWLDKEYDFGIWPEAAGPKKGVVRFVNKGPKEIEILEAKGSCGCTRVVYWNAPVAPGDTASLTIIYDPANLPGRFNKTVKVLLSDGKRQVIRIRGNVLGTPESLAMIYPVDMGEFRLSEDVVNAGTVGMGKTPSLFVNAYNTLSDSTTFAVRSSSPAVKTKLSEAKAGPGDIVTVALYFDSNAWGKYGPAEIPIEFISSPGTSHESRHEVMLRACVTPIRKPLSAKEIEKAPQAAVSPAVLDLGSIGNETRSCSLEISDTGGAPLDVIQAWGESSAISISGIPARIKKGKSRSFTVNVMGEKLSSGPFRQSLNIVTSDPVNPLITITVTGIKQ